MAISPGSLGFQQLATDPPAPPAGYCIIYSKTDNVIYLRDSSGAIIPLGTASGITSLTSDVTATGPGAAVATVAYVGGKTAAEVAASINLTQGATSVDFPLTLVKRDASGNFTAGIITASLTGAASLNVLKSGDTMSGSLNMGGNKVTNLDTPTSASEATRKDYVDSGLALKFDKAGGTITGAVTLTNNSVAALVVDTDVFVVDATNNRVGINKLSPTEALEVIGNIKASGTITGSNLSGTNTGDQTITLTGDVTGSGTGSFAATVNYVGGSTASNVHSAELLANAATSLNTPNEIVKRNSSGDFSAGTITANISGNVSGSSASFTGSLFGDVSGTQNATVVDSVGSKTATEVATSVSDTQAATNLNTASTLVKRDSSGNFNGNIITSETELITIGNILHGNVSGQETNVSKILQQQSSMGVMSGGALSFSGLSVTAQSGSGYLSIGTHPTDYLKYVQWSTQTVSVPASNKSYLYIDNSGTLQYSVTKPNTLQNVVLGSAIADNTTIYLIQDIPIYVYHIGNQNNEFLTNAIGPLFSSGSIVSLNVNPFRLNVTNGQYFYGTHQYNPSAGSAIFFTQFYRNGLGGYVRGSLIQDLATSVNNWLYDDNSGGLALVPATKFAKHSLYLVNDGVDQQYFLIYGQTYYNSLIEAESASLPTPPSFFNSNIVIIASIIVGQGLPVQEIRDERPALQSKASTISASATHGNLLGLSADDHPQYFRTDGTRQMAGDVDVNNNDINNAHLINATSGLNVQSGTYVANYTSQELKFTDPASIERTKLALGRIDLQDSTGITGSIRQDGGDLNFSISGSGQFKFNGQKVGQIGNGVAFDDAVAIGQFSHSNLFYVAPNGNDATADGSFPKPYKTIAAAITAASDGDVINILPGSYSESTVVLKDNIILNGKKVNITNGLSYTSTSLANTSIIIDGIDINYININASSAANGTVILKGITGSINRSDNNLNVFLISSESFISGGTVAGGSNNLTENVLIGTLTAQGGTLILENTKVVSRIEAQGPVTVRMLDCELFGPSEFINGTSIGGNTPTWEVDFATNYLGGYTGAINKTILGTVNMLGDVTGTQNATVVSYVNGKTAVEVSTSVNDTQTATNLNTPSTIVKRNSSGDFSAGTITANITGNVSGSSSSFTGLLSGDVSGGQSSVSVDTVGGKGSAEISVSVTDTQQATALNTVSTIVKRNSSGNFSAGTITANITGNVSGSAASFTGSLVGDVSGSQGATSVDKVGGKTSTEVATSVSDTQAATSSNTVSTIVKRDSSGDFSAGTITIGNGSAGSKTIKVNNGNIGSLQWNPSASRTLTLPDASDTLVGKNTTDVLTNKTISGGYLKDTAGSPTTFVDIANRKIYDSNGNFLLDLSTITPTGSVESQSTVIGQLTKSSPGTTAQFSIQNNSASGASSTDFVVNSDTSTDFNNYANFGLNCSSYSDPTWTINGSGDAYIYNNDNGLAIGANASGMGANQLIKFFQGGGLLANLIAQFSAAGVLQLGSQTGSSPIKLQFVNNNTGTIQWNPSGTITLTLPASQGVAGSYLSNDGSGNLSWSNPVTNIDGGNASTIYTTSQVINGGSA